MEKRFFNSAFSVLLPSPPFPLWRIIGQRREDKRDFLSTSVRGNGAVL